MPADWIDEAGERGAGPAVGREGVLGAELEAVLGQQVEEGPIAPAPRHGVQQGAGTSSLPSGPPSRYTTCESGQFRVRTTTSGSVTDAFSSTWTSPAGM